MNWGTNGDSSLTFVEISAASGHEEGGEREERLESGSKTQRYLLQTFNLQDMTMHLCLI